MADTQQVYGILLKMLDRWNAHDIDGYMEVYWESPELLVVVDAPEPSNVHSALYAQPTLPGLIRLNAGLAF